MKIEIKKSPIIDPRVEREKRERLGKLQVLVADRNTRTATLVKRILFSFGFRNMSMATSGKEALDLLSREPFDLIITEWNMAPVDGIELVRAIRMAKEDHRIRRDIPIIMLTAKTELYSVELARDAGITEFLAKPFSASTMSNRIIQIIDNPRAFIETPEYVGPCRRRRDVPPEDDNTRLSPALRKELFSVAASMEKISEPNHALRDMMTPLTGSDLLNKKVVEKAQRTLMKAENEFIEWARDYIEQMERAYALLCTNANDAVALQLMRDMAYAITSQAGIFGYDLGTEVGSTLIDYLNGHPDITPKTLVVIRKHIDTVNVIFMQNVKDHGQNIGKDLLVSLRKLIDKIG